METRKIVTGHTKERSGNGVETEGAFFCIEELVTEKAFRDLAWPVAREIFSLINRDMKRL